MYPRTDFSRSPGALRTGAVAIAIALPLTAPVSAQGESHRDEWQRVGAVLSALEAGPGSRIADVGAGGGYFTTRLGAAVGPEGRVFAVDISAGTLDRLRHRVEQEGLRNVELVLGETDDPRLPYGTLDGALIVNAYHEMVEHQAMLAGIRRALRPGGRLVILDNPPPDTSDDRESQVEDHNLALYLAEEDLREAGFGISGREPRFIDEESDGHAHRMWMIVATRPLHEPAAQTLPGAPDTPEGGFACAFPGAADDLRARPSPPDSAEVAIGAGRLKVCYSRPAARGRTVMGDLVGFGDPWRMGANEPTLLRTDVPVRIGDVEVAPGWVSLYAVPGELTWSIAVNGLVERPGAALDDWVVSHDLGRVTVPVETTGEHVEAFTIGLEPAGDGRAELILEWERTRVRLPIRAGAPDGRVPSAVPADGGTRTWGT